MGPNINNSTPRKSPTITTQNVEDFLLATNPCCLKMPAEILAEVQATLQARADKGEITEGMLHEFAERAGVERLLSGGDQD